VIGGSSPTAAADAGRAAAVAAESVNNSGLAVAADNEAVAAGNAGAISSPVSAPDITSSDLPALDTTPTSRGGTTPDTTTPDTGGSTPGGGDFGGSGYDGGMFGGAQSGDVGFAKGGLVKKKNKPAVKAKRGLASRK
jgi:hypothetical protein